MKVHNQFEVPLATADAWEILNDIPRVVRCAPGAELLETRHDGSYVGKITVTLGPVALSFRGVLVYTERDAEACRVVAEATGDEERGRGAARARVHFVLSGRGARTRVDVDTDVLLAGAIAQYGRGSALIQRTAQLLMDEFACNFAAEFAGPRTEPELSATSQPGESRHPTRPASLIRLLCRGLLDALKSWAYGTHAADGSK